MTKILGMQIVGTLKLRMTFSNFDQPLNTHSLELNVVKDSTHGF